MLRPTIWGFALLLSISQPLNSQDTFSIVAVDPETGEVGSAGASCISAANLQQFFPGIDPDFLGDLIPGKGAINTQASYLAANQTNANARMQQGMTPQEIISWLAANDAQGSPLQRQYGIAAIIDGQPQAAAYTGLSCLNQKGHRIGPNYSIQGNILSGTHILDSMEARFLSASGCLSHRLMEALQGANEPGADSRCLSNGTSSMFAFIKVAQPGDSASAPSLRLYVSYNPVGIEPIDSLQALYDAQAPCVSAVKETQSSLAFDVTIAHSPCRAVIYCAEGRSPLRVDVLDVTGRFIHQNLEIASGDAVSLGQNSGARIVCLRDAQGRTGVRKVFCSN